MVNTRYSFLCTPCGFLRCEATANLRTKILDFRGLDSSIILMSRGGTLMSIGNFLETLSQQILVGRFLVGRLGATNASGSGLILCAPRVTSRHTTSLTQDCLSGAGLHTVCISRYATPCDIARGITRYCLSGSGLCIICVSRCSTPYEIASGIIQDRRAQLHRMS